MDRKDGIYGKNLHELDLAGLAAVCGSVAFRSANREQGDTAHALRVEWVRFILDRSPHDDKKEASKASLQKRMVEFLATVPAWMMSGV